MKWCLVASLLGAASAIAVLVLSLMFGPALPISPLAAGSAIAPAVVIGALALRGTINDRTYRVLHRFSPAAKRLALLHVLLALAGFGVILRFSVELPQHRAAVTAAEQYATLVDPLRLTTGIALLVYAALGLLLLLRMHYRPPVVHR
ncbi:hypothetical protein [Kutzneria sp. NPDC052558]|uniref:hypothetical protein n=1 Tax=Kutzneria sp. NPDC052558 TaxID=3364121 RepID=UPI0037C4FE3D